MAEFRYTFPKITGDGYFWHLANKAEILTGQKPITRYMTGTSTVLIFSSELTVQQEADLTALFDDPNTTLDPVHPTIAGGDEFIIKDFWETRDEFKTAIGGLDFTVWYTESVPGSGVRDEIRLKFQKILTNKEKNDIIGAYGDMISKV